MFRTPVKGMHNVSRPGQPPAVGDVVEMETPGGFLMEVDPRTRTATAVRQRFRFKGGGEIVPVHGKAAARPATE
jgi:hypothetical protein